MSKILTVGQMDTSASYIFRGATGTYDSTKLVKSSLFGVEEKKEYTMNLTTDINSNIEGYDIYLYSTKNGYDDAYEGNYSKSWSITDSMNQSIDITDCVYDQEYMCIEFYNDNESREVEFSVKINNGWTYFETVPPQDTVVAEILCWEDYTDRYDEAYGDTISVHIAAESIEEEPEDNTEIEED